MDWMDALQHRIQADLTSLVAATTRLTVFLGKSLNRPIDYKAEHWSKYCHL